MFDCQLALMHKNLSTSSLVKSEHRYTSQLDDVQVISSSWSNDLALSFKCCIVPTLPNGIYSTICNRVIQILVDQTIILHTLLSNMKLDVSQKLIIKLI